MRAVVQRVTSSKVSVDGKTVGEIGKGFNVLLGVVEGDTDEQAILLAGKIARLRVFEDENGKMNLSVNDVDSPRTESGMSKKASSARIWRSI